MTLVYLASILVLNLCIALRVANPKMNDWIIYLVAGASFLAGILFCGDNSAFKFSFFILLLSGALFFFMLLIQFSANSLLTRFADNNLMVKAMRAMVWFTKLIFLPSSVTYLQFFLILHHVTAKG